MSDRISAEVQDALVGLLWAVDTSALGHRPVVLQQAATEARRVATSLGLLRCSVCSTTFRELSGPSYGCPVHGIRRAAPPAKVERVAQAWAAVRGTAEVVVPAPDAMLARIILERRELQRVVEAAHAVLERVIATDRENGAFSDEEVEHA